MSLFAITGIATKTELKFMRLVYVSGTLLAIVHLAEQKISAGYMR